MNGNQGIIPDNDEENNIHSLKMEENGRTKEKKFTNNKWKIIAFISSILALLFAVGMSVALGVFLVQTECEFPPRHSLASSNYFGSAEPGTEITYVCPRPLVFPDNQEIFILKCKENLQWNVTEIPVCVREGIRHCNSLLNDENFDLSLIMKDDLGIFKVELTLRGQLSGSYLLDVDSEDEKRCSYGEEIGDKDEVFLDKENGVFLDKENGVFLDKENGVYLDKEILLAPPRFIMDNIIQKNEQEKMDALPVYTVTVTDTIVDPGTPYEIRIRGSGNFVAVSILQGNHLNITFQEIDITSQETTKSSSVGIKDLEIASISRRPLVFPDSLATPI